MSILGRPRRLSYKPTKQAWLYLGVAYAIVTIVIGMLGLIVRIF